MTFWIDGDNFVREARDLLVRQGQRRGIPVVVVANRPMPYPVYPAQRDRDEALPPASFLLVPPGDDAADARIAGLVAPGDLVFTRDIRFARVLVEAGHPAFNDRGERFDPATIRERLSQGAFMADLRLSGLASSAGRTYGPKDLQALANALDRWLAQVRRPG